MQGKEDELTVITRAKELCQYILLVTDHSSKKYQRSAMVTLRLLGYIAMIGRESQCITGKQHSAMADKIMETQRLLYAWARSDQKRIEKG